MKSTIAFVALVLAAVANAQAAPPACATSCVAQTPTQCSQSDISCLCHDQNFISGATQCILTTCQGSDVQAAEVFAQQLCATVGVTLTSTPALPSSTGGASGSAPAASGSASGSASAPSGSQTAPAPNPSSASGASSPATTPSQTTGGAASASSSGSATTLHAGFTGLMGAVFAFFAL